MLDSFSGNNTGQRFKREGKRIRQLGSHIYKLSIKARGSKLNAGQVGVLSISDLFAFIEESIGALCFGGGRYREASNMYFFRTSSNAFSQFGHPLHLHGTWPHDYRLSRSQSLLSGAPGVALFARGICFADLLTKTGVISDVRRRCRRRGRRINRFFRRHPDVPCRSSSPSSKDVWMYAALSQACVFLWPISY